MVDKLYHICVGYKFINGYQKVSKYIFIMVKRVIRVSVIILEMLSNYRKKSRPSTLR